MKRMAFLTIAFVLTLAAVSGSALIAPASDGQDVAYAAVGDTGYIYAPPADVKANEHAGSSAVPVCDGTSGSILFYVPESYYVEVVETPFFYRLVDYCGLKDAYIEKDAVTAPPAAYENVTQSNAAPDLTLITRAPIKILNTENITSAEWTIKYLGVAAENGKFYVSASRNDTTLFGAVDAAAFDPVALPYHPVDEARRQGMLTQTPEGDPGGGNIAAPTSKTLRVILIIGIVLPALLIIFLLFKPTRDGGERGYDKRAMKKPRVSEYDRDRSYRPDRRPADYPEDRYAGRDRYPDSDRYPERERYDGDRYSGRYSGRDYDYPRDPRDDRHYR